MTFHNVLPRQGSVYCNRARLNLQANELRDMEMAVREAKGCVGGQRRVIALVFANLTLLALEEAFISMCRIFIAIIFRFSDKTQ